MLSGLSTLLGLMLVLVRTKCAPVDLARSGDCGVLKNRITDLERTVNVYQTNHDRLEVKVLGQQNLLDKNKKDGLIRRQFVDTMLERTSEEVFYLGEKYDSLYTDVDIIANMTQQMQHKTGDIQEKVTSYSNQASYLQQEINQIKGFLDSFHRQFNDAMKSHRSNLARSDKADNPKLARKMKHLQRKSDHFGRMLNTARGQTWAMKKNVRSIESRQSKIEREIRTLQQTSHDNMAIISNQFIKIQEKMDKSLVQFNATVKAKMDEMKEEIFNQVMSTAVQHLLLKPAKYILEQGWFPEIHHLDSDKD